MDLNNYNKEDLITLLLAVSMANETAKKVGSQKVVRQLNKWADEINSALKDVGFEETQLPIRAEVKINHHKYDFKDEAEATEFAKFWGVKC